jgi:hypothetical protein
VDIEGAPAEAAGSEPPATAESRRSLARRLLGLGAGGAAVALVPQLAGRAAASTPPGTGAGPTTSAATQPGAANISPISSPDTANANASTSSTAATTTTTTAPQRPTDADIELLNTVQSFEIAAYQLYGQTANLQFTANQRTVVEVVGQSHLYYAQAISGTIGREADNDADVDVVATRSAAFTKDVDSMLHAAFDLESALVATQQQTIGKLVGTDAAYLLASIATVEGRNCTVFADMLGEQDMAILLVDNEADALTPAKG